MRNDQMILAVTAVTVAVLLVRVGLTLHNGAPPRWSLLVQDGLHLLAWAFILLSEFSIDLASRPVRSGIARPLLLAGYVIVLVAVILARRRRP